MPIRWPSKIVSVSRSSITHIASLLLLLLLRDETRKEPASDLASMQKISESPEREKKRERELEDEKERRKRKRAKKWTMSESLTRERKQNSTSVKMPPLRADKFSRCFSSLPTYSKRKHQFK